MDQTERRAQIQAIAERFVRPNARDVDEKARFPVEAIEALKDIGALGASLPTELGGWGCSLTDLTEFCLDLGKHCGATAMVFAMHHIQVLSLLQHALDLPGIRDYLVRVAEEQRLIASGTSEMGPYGDMRQSVCFAESVNGKTRVVKKCTTISYVEQADDILIQARRSESSAPSDQLLVLGVSGTFELADIGGWDTLGMRGTCSPGGTLTIDGEAWQRIEVQFGEVASMTMSPVSHILWAGLWLGIGKSAEAIARSIVRAKAKRDPSKVPPEASELVRLSCQVQQMEASIFSLARDYEDLWKTDRRKLAELGFGLKSNNLKVTISEELPLVVGNALRIAGIMAYKNDTDFSLGRQLRDSYSCALMVNNQRIVTTNASTLLVFKDQ